MKILIFIPCYNCSKEVEHLIERLSKINLVNYKYSFLFIDNNSIDKTIDSILNSTKKFNLQNFKIFKNTENYGVGGSHKIAFYHAIENNFDHVCVLHGDSQSDPFDIEKLTKYQNLEQYSALLGSRFMSGSERFNYSYFRTFGNIAINFLYSLCLLRKITDLGSGLNFYSVEFLKSINFESFSNTHNFSHFLLLSLIVLKKKIIFFPIRWYQDQQVSNVNLLEIGFQSIAVLPKYMLYRYGLKKMTLNNFSKIKRNYEEIKY